MKIIDKIIDQIYTGFSILDEELINRVNGPSCGSLTSIAEVVI
jgi:hypothetical protein